MQLAFWWMRYASIAVRTLILKWFKTGTLRLAPFITWAEHRTDKWSKLINRMKLELKWRRCAARASFNFVKWVAMRSSNCHGVSSRLPSDAWNWIKSKCARADNILMKFYSVSLERRRRIELRYKVFTLDSHFLWNRFVTAQFARAQNAEKLKRKSIVVALIKIMGDTSPMPKILFAKHVGGRYDRHHHRHPFVRAPFRRFYRYTLFNRICHDLETWQRWRRQRYVYIVYYMPSTRSRLRWVSQSVSNVPEMGSTHKQSWNQCECMAFNLERERESSCTENGVEPKFSN